MEGQIERIAHGEAKTGGRANGGLAAKDAQQSLLTVVASVPSSAEFEPLLNVKEAAELLRLHPRTVQEWAKATTIPAIRLGKYWMFRKTDLDRWLRDRVQSPLPTHSR